MRGTGIKTTMVSAGHPLTRNDFLNCSFNSATPDYFPRDGYARPGGPGFHRFEDLKKKPLNVIVNQTFVRRFFPGQTPADVIGKLGGF